MFIEEIFSFSNLWTSLRLNALVKSSSWMFKWSIFCLQFEILLGWLFSQRLRWAIIDQRKQHLSSVSVFKRVEDLYGHFTQLDPFNSVVF